MVRATKQTQITLQSRPTSSPIANFGQERLLASMDRDKQHVPTKCAIPQDGLLASMDRDKQHVPTSTPSPRAVFVETGDILRI
jgi:hypothetical protein